MAIGKSLGIVPKNNPESLEKDVLTHRNTKSFSVCDYHLPETMPTVLSTVPSRVIKGAYGVPVSEQVTGRKKKKRPQWAMTNTTSAKLKFTRYSRRQVMENYEDL